MIVCQKCGTENENSAKFCKNPSCQSFLEWEGESVPTTQHPAIPAGGAGAGAPARPGGAPAAGGDVTQPGGPDPQDLLVRPSEATPRRPVGNPGQPSAVKPAEARPGRADTRRPQGA